MNQIKNFTRLLISRSAVLHNYETLGSVAETPMIPMIKSNAYGHGLIEIARILDDQNAPFFGVYTPQEVEKLHKANFSTKTLMFGPFHASFFDKNMFGVSPLSSMRSNLEMVVSSVENLQELTKSGIKIGIHLFVDTGLSREGIQLDQLSMAMQLLKNSNLKLNGLLTHLADADRQAGKSFTSIQRGLFLEVYRQVRQAGHSPYWIHTDATAGLSSKHIFRGDNVCTVSRSGLGLYGYLPSNWRAFSRGAKRVRPVSEYWSTIVQEKVLVAGSGVGYGHTYKTKKNDRVAVLPIGYADGLPRQLSNKGVVRVLFDHSIDYLDNPEQLMAIKATKQPKRSRSIVLYSSSIIGRISMNQTVIKLPPQLGKYSRSTTGLPAQLISNDPTHANSIREIAKRTGFNMYNVMTNLPESLERIVVE